MLSILKLYGQILPHFKRFVHNLIVAEHICKDFLVSSLPFLVKYNVVITLLVHSSIFCVNLALFGSKLMEHFINKQTKTYIHIYSKHSANYSKIWSTWLGLPEFGWLNFFILTNLISKCSKLLLKCIKMLCFRGAAPDPAGGATAHPRPPSLSPRAFGARHIMRLFYQKICLPNLPPKKWTPWVRLCTVQEKRKRRYGNTFNAGDQAQAKTHARSGPPKI